MNQAAVPDCGECSVCGGTGWEIYHATVFDYGEPTELPFARKCAKCSGVRRSEDKTGVPEKFHDADFSKFDFAAYSRSTGKLKDLCESFVKDFAKWDKYGKGLYLWSKTPGSGKTFLSSCLAKSIMMMHDLQMRFVTATDYISFVGDSYKRERGAEDQSQIYRVCKLLILDDIGAQKDGEWQNQELFRLINERMGNSGITIYTSNLPPDQLTISERTKDRIIKSSVVLQMPEESIRRKNATKEQELFLQAVL